MRRLSTWFLLLLLPPACGHPANTGDVLSDHQEQVVYEVVADTDQGAFDVDVTFPRGTGGVEACAPAVGTRRGEALEWLGTWADGEPAAVAWRPDGCFTVPAFSDHFRAVYRVRVEPEEYPAWRAMSLSPVARANLLVFPGESLFMEFPGRSRGEWLSSSVRLRAPGPIFSTFAEAYDSQPGTGIHELSVVVTSNHDLIHSHVAVGVDALGTDAVAIGMDPTLADPELTAELLADTLCITEQLADWVPDRANTARVLFLDAPWDAGALAGFSRGNGVVVQTGAAVLAQRESRRPLIAHELFHRYNGDGVQFAEDDYDQTNWFREGGTSYVAAVSLVQSGLLDEAWFVQRLSEHASNYLMNPATSGHTGSELDWRRLPYDRGVLLSLAIDLALRDMSGGQRSLFGFWRYLADSSAWEQQQSNASLQRLLTDYSGIDFGPFFDRYVRTREVVPVHALLRNAGFAVSHTTKVRARFDMAVTYDVDRVHLVVDDVSADGMAARAGVEAGDIVLPTAETRFDGHGDVVEFEVMHGDGTRRFVRLWPRAEATPALALAPLDVAAFRTILTERGSAPACR